MNIVDIMRLVVFWIDGIIYKFIGIIYNLLMEIANTTIFTEDVIDLFASKVYALLGIFMLFKVSFSIMTYIVNPDEFADKNKGFSKLITNIIITLTLLILTPWIFSQAMDIQRIVLKDNLIGRIFTSSTTSGINTNTGESLAYRTFTAFYHINFKDFPSCEGIEANNENSEECKEALKLSEDKYNHYKSYLTSAYMNENISYLQNTSLLSYEKGQGNPFVKNEGYMMEYHPLVSTAVGVFMILILITFCFDIAVRSVKLGFLRVIAPVPIISKIDPKGKGMFDKWMKNCISTYLDLFLRLLAIFFAIFIIEQVFYMDFVDQTTGLPTDVNLFTKIFIIMGALLFAKQLPKLLSDLTGAKLDGKFTLNPFDKLRQVPVIGSATSTAAALAGGAITGGIAGYQGGHTGRGIAQGILGAAHSIKGKVPLMGGDGKSIHPLTTGWQAGHKAVTGKDFSGFSPFKLDFGKKGKEEIDELKRNKYDLQGEQASLDAELKSYYDQYTSETNELKRNQIREKIEANRSAYGKLAKEISVIDDQIADIKRVISVEESPRKDLNDALAHAARIRENKSNTTSDSSLHTTINNNTTLYSNPQTTVNNSNTTINSNPETVVNSTPVNTNVTLNPGETISQGGVILQSGYDRPSSRKESTKEPHQINPDYSENSDNTQHGSEW